MTTIEQIRNFNEEECMGFLMANYGTHGVNGTGILKKPEDRTIDNLRVECERQFNYSHVRSINITPEFADRIKEVFSKQKGYNLSDLKLLEQLTTN